MVPLKHCQLRVIYCLVFSYPTPCLQPAKPDKLSCLGHLDETIHITSSTTTPLLTHQQGIKSFQSTATTWLTQCPKRLLHGYLLCYYSALSLAQHTWHISPASARAPHVLSSALSHWGSCCCAQTEKEKASKQAQELSSSGGV